MTDEQSLERMVNAVQEHLSQAEAEVQGRGQKLQFLVSAGNLEIVLRGPTGETLRPKVVIARLTGCDPMLWQPEHPAWLRALASGEGAREVPAKGGNGQPPTSDEGPEPPR